MQMQIADAPINNLWRLNFTSPSQRRVAFAA
jgi:hypothetical protein